MTDTDWPWKVCNAGFCGECNRSMDNEPYFTDGERDICLDCTAMVLNAREDFIKDLEQDLNELENRDGK